MDPLQLFQSFLNKFVLLPANEFDTIIVPHIEVRIFKKREIITNSGEVEGYINFVAKGLVRKYFVKDGDEILTQISREGQVIHSQDSFYGRMPSDYVLDAIEHTTLLSISFENMETIYNSSASMERLGRLILTYIMVLNDRWQLSLLKQSPRERFLLFVQNSSELMQRVPQKYLASLLNIQPETFSRFKHLLRNQSSSQGSGSATPATPDAPDQS